MRRLALLAALPLLASLAVPASAVEGRHATLLLLRQAPWNTPEQQDIRLRVRATNDGTQPLRDLSLAITVFTPTLSRTSYEESFLEDSDPPLLTLTADVEGSLEPGDARTLSLPRDIRDGVAQRVFAFREESAVYPMKFELRSRDTTVAELRSPVIFLRFSEDRRRALNPLRVGWAFVLDRPVMYGPDGTFLTDELEQDVAPGGVLRAEAAALAAMAGGRTPRPVDLVVSPTLLEQVERMAAGYRVQGSEGIRVVAPGEGGSADAAAVLEALRTAATPPAGTTEVVAMPLGSPAIPAMISAGLDPDLNRLIKLGVETTQRLTGADPADDLFWHPGGYIDEVSIHGMRSRGVDTFLLEDGRILRPLQPNEFAHPATASLPVTSGTSPTAVAPDEGLTRMLASGVMATDPRLGVQAVLGELAQIWLEQPGITRGISVVIPEDLDLSSVTYGRLVRWMAAAPWVQFRKLSKLPRVFPPDPGSPADLVPNHGPDFSDSYLEELQGARLMIDNYRAMLVGESDLPDRLEHQTLIATGGAFAEDETSGTAFLADVQEQLQARFDLIATDTSSVVTLTSREGIIPLLVTNDGDDHVRVIVRLDSLRLEPTADVEVVLAPHSTVSRVFRVTSLTTGRFPVGVQIFTPNDFQLGEEQLLVRSTAYNVLALVITFGAAFFLLLWWGRRFLPRRRAA